GLGKSRLLDELAKRFDGVRVGRAGCSELERHLPYVPLAGALRDALTDVELGRCLPALACVLPELSLDAPRPDFDDVEARESLAPLSAKPARPVLFIADVHLADGRTPAAISYLRRRGNGVAGAIVITRDVGDGGDLLGRLSPDPAVSLEPFSEGDLVP